MKRIKMRCYNPGWYSCPTDHRIKIFRILPRDPWKLVWYDFFGAEHKSTHRTLGEARAELDRNTR